MEELPGGVDGDERIRDAITLAKNMRSNEASLGSIDSRMANRGFGAMAIKAVMQHVPREEPDNIIVSRETQAGGNVFIVVVGIVIMGLGALLVIGNRTGFAPTISMLGFIVMTVGGAVMGLARN